MLRVSLEDLEVEADEADLTTSDQWLLPRNAGGWDFNAVQHSSHGDFISPWLEDLVGIALCAIAGEPHAARGLI